MSAERLQLAEDIAPDHAAPDHAAHVASEPANEPFALREQVAQRLAAHRNRKHRTATGPLPHPATTHPARAILAARVAERYAQSQSYRAFLAEEAERAVRQAEAAAQIARRNADAVAAAQYNLLQELDQYAEEEGTGCNERPGNREQGTANTHPPLSNLPPRAAKGRLDATHEATSSVSPAEDLFPIPCSLFPNADRGSFTVRLPEDIHLRATTPPPAAPSPFDRSLPDPEEALSLDEEIAFRHSPVFDPVEPTVEIPANLIEFPRQLVASRRARPRLAEGPLREDSTACHDSTQLRIFEVETEQLSTTPAIEENDAPEWSNILLDAQPRTHEANTTGYPPNSGGYVPLFEDASFRAERSVAEESPHFSQHASAPAATSPAQHVRPTIETRHLYATRLDVAPLELRIMSAAVDTVAVLAAFFIFAAVAAGTAAGFSPGGLHLPLATAAAASFVAIALLGIGYQYFFFTFGESTPGMRYARIALCTFSDENPTRDAMRGRIFALALSSATLGLGLLWTFLDEDRLGWHDRISRMYQRAY